MVFFLCREKGNEKVKVEEGGEAGNQCHVHRIPHHVESACKSYHVTAITQIYTTPSVHSHLVVCNLRMKF